MKGEGVLALALCLVVTTIGLLSGCSAPPDTDRSVTADQQAYARSFLTTDDLLTPPEIWGFLDASTAARLRYTLARTAAEVPTPWPLDRDQTWQQLRAELTEDPIDAVALTRAAYPDADPAADPALHHLWSTADLAHWWHDGVEQQDVNALATLTDAVGLDRVRRFADRSTLTVLSQAAAGPDRLPAELARQLLAELGHAADEPAGTASGHQVSSPADAAELLLRDARSGVAPSRADPLLLRLAQPALATDDQVLVRVVQAYAAVGDLDGARAALAGFDQRRLLPGGLVLAPPVFAGSVGSTFRMIRHLDRIGGLETFLDAPTRGRIATAVRGKLGVDRSHELAGLATLAILEPASRDTARERAVVAAALHAERADRRLDSVQAALAWAAVQRYAAVMEVPMEFPGLTARAVAEWSAHSDQEVVPSIYTVLIAAGESHAARSAETAQLADRLQHFVRTRNADSLDSLTLFGSARALQLTIGSTVFPTDELARVSTGRTNQCRGAIEGFLRTENEPHSTCNVDATDLALDLTDQPASPTKETPR